MDTKEKIRTPKQNNALHEFCIQLAAELNDHGIGQKIFLQYFEIDNSMESIKNVFREIGRLKYGKKSTADLTTKELQDIYEEINRQTSKLGIHVPFPSEEGKAIAEGKIY